MGKHFVRKITRDETSARTSCLSAQKNLGPLPTCLLHLDVFSPFLSDILLMVVGPAHILSRHLGNVRVGWRRFKSPSLTP